MLINKFFKKLLITVLSLTLSRYTISSYAEPISKEVKNNLANIDKNYFKSVPENFYILGPADVLEVIVSRDYPELNTFTMVTSEGTINIPKLKKIYVEGLTISELTNLMNESYKDFVLYPAVEIQIKDYRPIKVSVDGEITAPFQGLLTTFAVIEAIND